MQVLFVVLFTIFWPIFAQNNKEISTESLIDLQNQIQILDFRSNYDRELNGYISNSILIPENLNEENTDLFIDK